MRSSLLSSGLFLAGCALAAPRPQDIDFALADAIPNPTYATTQSVVTYDASAILESAMPQITSLDTSDALTTGVAKMIKRGACATQPAGAGPVPSPDSASAFVSYSSFSSQATSAPVPAGYSQTFKNLQASNNAYGYMGYTLLKSYDTNACANKCNTINGCMAINIYFERDPSVDPGSGNSGCANPASTTNIKCVFWGGPVSSDNALNSGQWRNQFQVVIAGSNGYVNNSIISPAGYGGAVDLGTSAINAPYDKYGFNSYMGSAIFNSGPFNVQLCADACSQKSAYAIANPPTDGSPVQTCQFFNTYILYVNSQNNLQGQYCAMYSESWSSSYATNNGQTRGNDHYLIEYSYTYSNSSNPGAASPNAAVHQASKEISASTLQPFCSSYLGYSAGVTTATSTSTSAPYTVVSVTEATVTTTVAQAKRSANALSTPDVLTKYPSAILSSACSLQATPVSSTSTFTTVVVTTLATSTSTVDVTATSTVTSPTCIASAVQNLKNFAIQASYNSQYAVSGSGENSYASFTSSDKTGAQSFYLDSNCILTEASGANALFQGNQDNGVNDENVFFNSVSSIAAHGYAPVTCQVDSSYNLACAVNGNTISYQINDIWYMTSNGVSNPISLKAVQL